MMVCVYVCLYLILYMYNTLFFDALIISIFCYSFLLLSLSTGTINYLSFDDNDKHLFSSSDDGTVCVWSTRDWQCLHQLTGHK